MMNLQQAAALVPLSRLVGDGRTDFRRVHTDTRSIEAGDLFVALKGENFDAQQFLMQAREKGAVAAIAQQGCSKQVFRVWKWRTPDLLWVSWLPDGVPASVCPSSR